MEEVAVAYVPEAADEDEEDTGKSSKKKGGKKGGGKGGGKSKGKGKDKGGEVAELEEEDGEQTVLDEIWPKKEALGLTKW
jgi:PUA domain protein